jgi:hypothetical protein
MQRRCKNSFTTIARVYFLHGPCKVVIKKISVEAVQSKVKFRDSSLPGYELGSRGIEMSWQLQNNGKKGVGLYKEGFMCAAVTVRLL